jgi:hypothetical protein
MILNGSQEYPIACTAEKQRLPKHADYTTNLSICVVLQARGTSILLPSAMHFHL